MTTYWIILVVAVLAAVIPTAVLVLQRRTSAGKSGATVDKRTPIEKLQDENKLLTASSSKFEGEATALRETVAALKAIVNRDQVDQAARDQKQNDRISALETQLADALARITTPASPAGSTPALAGIVDLGPARR